MKKTIIALVSITIGVAIFLSGVIFGHKYEYLLDPLCSSKPFLAVTTEDLNSDNITIKKGTFVALRQCEYADRFSIMFYAPNKLESNLFEHFVPKTEEEKSEYKKIGISMAQYGVDPVYSGPIEDEHPNPRVNTD
jgi:hypothetical protein